MELLFTLPSLIQMNDRSAAHAGIESRSPFLDFEVYRHSMSLKDCDKIAFNSVDNSFITKKVLREIARGIVPDCIIDCREKVGLHVPMEKLFKGNGSGRGKFDRSEYAKYSQSIWEEVVEQGKVFYGN
jgi:asparagine synthetase B (glutamine-hydrolysing)